MENLDLLEVAEFEGVISHPAASCARTYSGPIAGAAVGDACRTCHRPIGEHLLHRGRFTVPVGQAEDVLIRWLAEAVVADGEIEYEIVLTRRAA